MIFDFYNQFGALNSQSVFKSFEIGLIKKGHSVKYHSGKGDVAVIWSVLWNGRMKQNQNVFYDYMKQGKPVVVLEIGFLKRDLTPGGTDPRATWKIGINGINLNNFYVQGKDDTRFNELKLNLQPWNTGGEHILICGQHEKSEQWRGMPSGEQWLKNTIIELRKHTQRPIRVRSHPRCPLRIPIDDHNAKYSNLTMKQDFQNCWAVVNHCSGPGIEAVMSGIPAFVHKSSLASPVASTDLSTIETPVRPERAQWANDLAWTEWTQQEMIQGIPQTLICEKLV